jgi:hypothetical protein
MLKADQAHQSETAFVLEALRVHVRLSPVVTVGIDEAVFAHHNALHDALEAGGVLEGLVEVHLEVLDELLNRISLWQEWENEGRRDRKE